MEDFDQELNKSELRNDGDNPDGCEDDEEADDLDPQETEPDMDLDEADAGGSRNAYVTNNFFTN